MKAPEKIWMDLEWIPHFDSKDCITENSIEYVSADVFIEKALKWYCLDCECNDNCKDTKCFFYREYERYLKGEMNALPPKFSCGILNEDGSTSENWRYRHFTTKMTDAFIEKACKYIKEHLFDYWSQSVTNENKFIEGFEKYMKEE